MGVASRLAELAYPPKRVAFIYVYIYISIFLCTPIYDALYYSQEKVAGSGYRRQRRLVAGRPASWPLARNSENF